MSSRIPCGCPFIAQQNIGGHVPEASDRHCTGRPDSTWAEARAYMELYHREKKIPERLASRLEAVRHEIESTGTYWQTADELAHGARVAWRNSNRCIGRLYWESLRLRDMRHLATEEEIFQACAEHLRVAYNSGKIRPTITVFSPVVPGGVGIRIWNSQLIRYAGYRQGDGSVIGDPLNIALTDALRPWVGRGSRDSLRRAPLGDPTTRQATAALRAAARCRCRSTAGPPCFRLVCGPRAQVACRACSLRHAPRGRWC